MAQEIWLSKKNNNNKEEEDSDLPACHISETVSSLVLKLGLQALVGWMLGLSGGTRISLLYQRVRKHSLCRDDSDGRARRL